MKRVLILTALILTAVVSSYTQIVVKHQINKNEAVVCIISDDKLYLEAEYELSKAIIPFQFILANMRLEKIEMTPAILKKLDKVVDKFDTEKSEIEFLSKNEGEETYGVLYVQTKDYAWLYSDIKEDSILWRIVK